jgi:hypothetical protein
VRPLLGGVADVDDLDAVGVLLQFGEVRGVLLVVGQAVVVAEVEPEVLLRGGDLRLVGGAGRGEGADDADHEGQRREQAAGHEGASG